MSPIRTTQIACRDVADEVRITYDEWHVPHIQATNARDLFFAQGFVTAADRLWQMDYNRRVPAGRLAEIMGERELERDYEMRRVGLAIAARDSLHILDEETMEVLQAYAAGVNAYVRQCPSLPPEFEDIGYVPEPWGPIDSLTIWKHMCWWLSSGLSQKLNVARLTAALGPEAVAELLSPLDDITVIGGPGSAIPSPLLDGFAEAEELLARLWPSLARAPCAPVAQRQGAGSNNWVIAPAKSGTGHAMLANDPHLTLTVPPVWYEVDLKGGGFNVAGVSIPGCPGVAIGHNDRIAWGCTNVGPDVLDVFVSEADPRDEIMYVEAGRRRRLQRHTETIRYRADDGTREVQRDVWLTHHGPVFDRTESGHILSFRWLEHAPINDVGADLKIARARNLYEFRAALHAFWSPAQNFVYADVDGNVFYRAQGKIPRRSPRACFPLPGEADDGPWPEFVRSEELPSLENPPEGFICTANNWPAPAGYSHYIAPAHAAGLRARHIYERLRALDAASFDDMKALQTDSVSGEATRLLPHLLRAAEGDEDLQEFVRPLRGWNGEMLRDSVAPTVFYAWLRHVAAGITLSRLPPDLRDFVRWSNLLTVTAVVASLEGTARFDWFDGRDPRQLAKQARWCAEKQLTDELGREPAKWRWGRVHQLALEHPLGGRYNRESYPCDGGVASVSPAAFAIVGDDRTVRSGASLRMIVELREGRIRAEAVIPGGQRADTRDGDSDDQLPLWLAGRYRPMYFYPDEIEAAAAKVVVLKPAG
ncbi:MAG: penicillin acylase family protein [Armatimonadota bacterium]